MGACGDRGAARAAPPAVQVERLQRKFAMIHSTLAQQQAAKGEPDTPKLRQSADGMLQQHAGVNASLASLQAGANLNVSAAPGRQHLPCSWACSIARKCAVTCVCTSVCPAAAVLQGRRSCATPLQQPSLRPLGRLACLRVCQELA